jgi:hypothetical protein
MRMQRMKQNGERPLLGRRRIKTATGGLLRQIGERGILVIKDVTSILSMHREMRSAILAALREIQTVTGFAMSAATAAKHWSGAGASLSLVLARQLGIRRIASLRRWATASC